MRRLLAAAFLLLVSLVPAPAQAVPSPGQFVLRCKYSHTLPDDPIVFPDQPGASHLHDFFGNTTVDAHSTVESLLAGPTTCRVASDTAGYWSPTGYLNGERLVPPVMRIYYLAVRGATVETIPPGLQVIGGNKAATSAAENPHVQWSCGQTKAIRTPLTDHPYNCKPWAGYRFVDGVVGIVNMPNCWDGVGLKPENVVYPVEGSCPPGFSHVLPKISQRTHFGVMNPLNPDGSVALNVASGPYYTFHADFWNTWQQDRLDQIVADCLVAGVHCGSVNSAPQIDWVRQFGTSRYDLAFAVATDPSGVYAAGFANLALPGQDYHRGSDAFVGKYRPNGGDIWIRQFGTSGTDQARAIALDETGIYAAGDTDGTFHGLTGQGAFDGFIRKFDPRGNELWTQQFGTSGNERVLAVAADPHGVYIAGSTDGVFSGRPGHGGLDAFVSKYSSKGARLWTRQFGTPGTDEAVAISVDRSGIYVAGSTDANFPEQPGSGGVDAFVRKYRPSGEQAWTSQFGTPGTDRAAGIVARSTGIYLAGSTDGALDGPGQGGLDGFVRKLNARGSAIWTRQFGSPGTDEAQGIAVLSAAVYVVTSTDGAFPGQANAGEWDAVLSRYNSKGEAVWTRQFGTPDFDLPHGIAVDDTGLYVAGETHGAFEGQTNAGDRDVFLTKIKFT